MLAFELLFPDAARIDCCDLLADVSLADFITLQA
jgi:hypothetical protein